MPPKAPGPPGPPGAPPMAPGAPSFKAPSTKGRGALLDSISKGKKLKKTVTVDKSGPDLSEFKKDSGGGSGGGGSRGG